MTKVLYFLNSTVRGGVEEHVLCLLRFMDRDSFEPVIVCPPELLTKMEGDFIKQKVKYYPVRIRRWTDFSEIRKYLYVLNREKPDIVHSHLFFATFFSAPLSKLAGVPVTIETAHIREAWRKGLKRAFIIDRFFYRFVDEIIAVSEAVKRFLVKEKGVPAEKITVIHNGVDLERFAGQRREAAAGEKRRAGRDQGKRREQKNTKVKVGVIGRLEEQKGHKYFLNAVRLLKSKADKAEFIIVGEGRLKRELENLCLSYMISNKVKFLGFRSDIIPVLGSLDILVLPSLFEGLPLVALEASAMQKAVIVTDVDGSPEAVLHGETGLVVPSKDSKALKEAMERLIDDPQLRRELGQRARKRVEEHFDLKKQVRETEEIYRRC